jgi:hypothetical protein
LALTAEVSEEKAANIALAVVAAKARGALIDACAAYREGDSQVRCFVLAGIRNLSVLRSSWIKNGIVQRLHLDEVCRKLCSSCYGWLDFWSLCHCPRAVHRLTW